MRFSIDLREQRHIGGPDRICERLLKTPFWSRVGLESNPVAMRADDPRSPLEARIELVRSGRLREIESLCAHVNGNSDAAIPCRSIANEERASHCGAQNGPGSHKGCFGVHANLLGNPAVIVRFIDNESSGEELDTPES
jgi:hypothetical protein